MSQNILKKLDINHFTPLPLLSNGKIQTVAAYWLPVDHKLDNETQHLITLANGDQLIIVENLPTYPCSSKRIVVLVHGLTGSHLSKYVVRAAHLLLEAGFHVIRVNLRGCGPGKGRAQHLYHAGNSGDCNTILEWLSNRYPQSPVTQVGYSLGANITLKMGGEKHQENLDSIVAVSSPLDLHASVEKIIQKNNAVFNDFFMDGLREEVTSLHQAFPALPKPSLDKMFNLYDFDTLYTAPRNGFKNAEDYYQHSSAGFYLPNIKVPTLLLYAKDDPLISTNHYETSLHQKNIDVLFTEYGGHIGWLGFHTQRGIRWMDQVILQWIKWHDTTIVF